MADLDIGFEVLADTVDEQGINDRITGRASATDAISAQAIGVDNTELGDSPNAFSIDLDGGRDTIKGDATARAGEEAFADGIRNTGRIELGSKADRILGTGRATTTGDGRVTFATGINSTARASNGEDGDPPGYIDMGSGDDAIIVDEASAESQANAFATGVNGGRIDMDRGNDTIEGNAHASGIDDVGATGILFEHAETGDGKDILIGHAIATGSASTDARGISVGLSDIDDDSLQNPADTDAFPIPLVGQLTTGNGDDRFIASASATADANLGFGDLFFANATAIVNDGGLLEQLRELLEDAGLDPDNITADAVEQVIDDLDTSTLDTGAGNDTMEVTAEIDVTGGVQGVEGGDEDLEVFVEGVENSGLMTFGDGNDSIVATIKGRAKGAAKILAEGVDNSGVGVSTGLDLEEANEQTIMDFGAGNDSITVNTDVVGHGDLAAGDGIDTRSNLLMGDGDDSIYVNAVTEFVRDLDIPGDQEEGISDGIENRRNVDLGSGHDTVTATVQTTGNGILTIAEAIESRFFWDTGSGDDTFNLKATAIASEHVLSDNLTQAAGLQTEQITSGTFLLGKGEDTVIAHGIAVGRDNRETLAFGITQVTADATAPEDPGMLDAGKGNDTLEGTATASGTDNNQVEAHGLLLSNALAGAGDARFLGEATATAGNLATANGIRVGVSNDNVEINGERLPEPLLLADGQNVIEAGTLDTGPGRDTITGVGKATTTSNGTSTLFNDVNGILIDVESNLNSGNGDDTITGTATTIDKGDGGGPFNLNALSALSADGIEVRGGLFSGGGNDTIVGTGVGEATNSFVVVEGVDIGLGSQQNGIPVTPIVDLSDGNDLLMGTGKAIATGDEAAVITAGIQSVGNLNSGEGSDRIVARSESTVIGGVDGVRGSRADGLQNGLEFGGASTPGIIEMGAGHDSIEAEATAESTEHNAFAAGISQAEGSAINLGEGRDTIVAKATAIATSVDGTSEAIGIFGGAISTGSGNDAIRGRSNSNLVGSSNISLDGGQGLGGDVDIDLGKGSDILQGFGDATANGGAGIDTLFFEFSLRKFVAGGGAVTVSDSAVDFTFGGVTFSTSNFERFRFDGSTGGAGVTFSSPTTLTQAVEQMEMTLEPTV